MTSESPSNTVSVESNEVKPIDIKLLFDCKRIKSFSDFIFIILYLPLGICLLTLRVIVLIYILVSSNFYNKSSTLKRFLFLCLGISINDENLPLKSLDAKHLIANHISDFDSLVLHLVYPGVFLSSSTFPKYIKWICGYSNVSSVKEKCFDILESIKQNVTPVVYFPESSKTNGKNGLFKFETWPFSSDLNFHLIFIEAKRPLFNISLSTLESNWISDLFWLLFLPVTNFHIRYISSIKKNENETAEDFSKRVQLQMADKTNLKPSNFNECDKKELIKRLNTEKKINRQKSYIKNRSNKAVSSKNCLTIEEMAIKVKEVLPQVPVFIIKSDILITKNIDSTIERILNGTVKYEPEVSKSVTVDKYSNTNSTGAESSKLFYCGSSTFGKSASERAKSFEERKEQLFRVARVRYIQKYGLDNSN